ncbi:SMI1/KNR4 family protein [Leisingera sp. M523]|uniref:SMI1/KNR4 family protein n=1 Tax=Leisingera sp. M523 TaxID=2867013 RepID=UPI0021A2BDB0|nr:SMI1/KNR4 family protein [Leisingera sp. M523]UWQ30474.1 SMI1/KNR4 family protein [Leisingera sp. M523]
MPWPVDERYLEECEKALGLALPTSYRSSLMSQNGGDVVCDGDIWKMHPIWDKSEKKRLQRTSNDVVRETKIMSGWFGWPSSAVCLAANGTGDALVFLTNEEVCGPEVHRWFHETGQTKKVAIDFSKLKRT